MTLSKHSHIKAHISPKTSVTEKLGNPAPFFFHHAGAVSDIPWRKESGENLNAGLLACYEHDVTCTKPSFELDS